MLVGAGSICLGYSGQSLYLPNWFHRSRGLAIGLAFAGVGVGSVTLLPWVQVDDRPERLADRLHRDRDFCF